MIFWDVATVATLGGAEELRVGATVSKAVVKTVGRRGLIQLVADPNLSISAASTAIKASNCETTALDKISRKITAATEAQQPDLRNLFNKCQTEGVQAPPGVLERKRPVDLLESDDLREETSIITTHDRRYVAASLLILSLALYFSNS